MTITVWMTMTIYASDMIQGWECSEQSHIGQDSHMYDGYHFCTLDKTSIPVLLDSRVARDSHCGQPSLSWDNASTTGQDSLDGDCMSRTGQDSMDGDWTRLSGWGLYVQDWTRLSGWMDAVLPYLDNS